MIKDWSCSNWVNGKTPWNWAEYMGTDKMLFTVLSLFLRAKCKWNIFLAQIRLFQVIHWLLLTTEHRDLSMFPGSCKPLYPCSLKDTLATVWIGCCTEEGINSHGTRVHEILLVYINECNISKFSQPSFSCSYGFFKNNTYLCADSCLVLAQPCAEGEQVFPPCATFELGNKRREHELPHLCCSSPLNNWVGTGWKKKKKKRSKQPWVRFCQHQPGNTCGRGGWRLCH